MGKKTPSMPPAPDPAQTAAINAQYNKEAAITQAELNRVNQYTPEGSLVYRRAGQDVVDADTAGWLENNPGLGTQSQEYAGWREAALRNAAGGENRWEAVTSYSPEQQKLYDLSNQAQQLYGQAGVNMLQGVQESMSKPFQYDVQDRTGQLKYGADFTGIGDPNQARDAVQEALLARINPDQERDRAALENRLVNQGLSPGTEAWNRAMLDHSRATNDARYGAIMNAGQEQSRMFGLGFQNAGFNNQTVNQAYGMDQGRLEQLLALRSQPINEASALLTGSMVQQPTFTQAPQVQVGNTGYIDAVGQQQAGNQANYNSQVSQANAQRTGMYGIGAAALTAAGTAAVVI